jgi:hypothetical protein
MGRHGCMSVARQCAASWSPPQTSGTNVRNGPSRDGVGHSICFGTLATILMEATGMMAREEAQPSLAPCGQCVELTSFKDSGWSSQASSQTYLERDRMDVRHSDIANLEEKVKKLSYLQYLPSMKLLNVRSFDHQGITFDFPVTAIIGTNGGGKSTILGAAALAYKTVKPGDFFPKSNIGDNSMANWRIEYDILDRKENKIGPFPRNARFTKAKWRRDNAR